jgi:hypothetical protein
MKANKIIVVLLFILVLTVIIVGCKYDVAEPLWDKPASQGTPSPVITGIVPPDSARPGVNTITIQGRNFNDSLNGNLVYIEGIAGNIISSTSSAITITRPNLSSNASTAISVVSNGAFLVAKYSPYKFSPVLQKYGSFLDNVSLSTLAVDSADNLYVMETANFKVHRVTPSGVKTVAGTTPWNPIDMKVGPGGNVYFTTGSREIAMLDVKTGVTTTRWRWLSQGRLAKSLDFSNNGYVYFGGSTDLFILSLSTQASSSGITTPIISGLYPAANNNTILALHVYNGFVYIAVKTDLTQAIYKHAINADGTLGPQITVLDWGATKFSSYSLKDFALAADLTTLYIQTNDAAENLFVVTSQGIASFYKGILPPYGVFSSWCRNSTYLYMICGNTSAGSEWNVYRVDMGAKSAPQ